MFKIYSLFLTLILSLPFFSQVEEGKRITKELCSEKYFGRGYIKSGDSLAAEFLASEFEKRGLKKVKKSWFQSYAFDVNTFPKEMNLYFDKKELIPGKDFMVDPSSGSSFNFLNYKYFSKVDFADETKILNVLREASQEKLWNAVVFDFSGVSKDTINKMKVLAEYFVKHVDVILVSDEKFTFSVSNKQFEHAFITIQSAVFQKGPRIQTKINAQLKKNHQARNVMAILPARKKTKKTIVVCAHYDHLGGIGNFVYFPGGNDNASGTSMLLTLADEFKSKRLNYNILFIAFSGEEAGLLGSKHFIENPLVKLKHIKFVLNLDIMGSGEEGITVVNATKFPDYFDKLNAINEKENLLAQVKKRGEAANSDHYFFTQKGIPSFFIYTMGPNKNYHDIFDTYENLSFNEYDDLIKLISLFLRDL
jgi:aminopeptidase YwaD